MAEKKVKESKVKGNSLGASGFTLGVFSILSPGLMGMIMAIIGSMFCFTQQKNKPTKLGKAGLILNIVGFILSAVYLIWVFFFGGLQFFQSLNTSFPKA
ncbi:MAG: hypothetical protein AABX99_01725 [Nanoarchaeota archaeon]